MVPLIVGTVLALVALTYVLWPLITAAERSSGREGGTATPATGREDEVTVPSPEGTPLHAISDDIVEAEIRRVRAQIRSCPVCGPRPEPAARYCSRCGRALA